MLEIRFPSDAYWNNAVQPAPSHVHEFLCHVWCPTCDDTTICPIAWMCTIVFNTLAVSWHTCSLVRCSFRQVTMSPKIFMSLQLAASRNNHGRPVNLSLHMSILCTFRQLRSRQIWGKNRARYTTYNYKWVPESNRLHMWLQWFTRRYLQRTSCLCAQLKVSTWGVGLGYMARGFTCDSRQPMTPKNAQNSAWSVFISCNLFIFRTQERLEVSHEDNDKVSEQTENRTHSCPHVRLI